MAAAKSFDSLIKRTALSRTVFFVEVRPPLRNSGSALTFTFTAATFSLYFFSMARVKAASFTS